MITRIAIEVIEIGMLGQPFNHFVNEGQWEVIFPGGFVKHLVVDAHSLTSNSPVRYELTSLVLDHCHASLLWDYLDWANYSLPCTGYMIHVCSNFRTSFLTTSLIASLSRRWCSLDGLWSGSIGMRWVHRLGLIPFKSCREYPMTDRYFSRTATSRRVSLSVSLSLMTTGVALLL